MKSFKQYLTEGNTTKTLRTGVNQGGLKYALTQVVNSYDKKVIGKFCIYVRKGNYSGNVRGGIQYKWYIVNDNKNSMGIYFDTKEEADKYFDKLLKGKKKR